MAVAVEAKERLRFAIQNIPQENWQRLQDQMSPDEWCKLEVYVHHFLNDELNVSQEKDEHLIHLLIAINTSLVAPDVSKILDLFQKEKIIDEKKVSVQILKKLKFRQVYELLTEELCPLIESANGIPSIELIGINDHGLKHIETVAQNAEKLSVENPLPQLEMAALAVAIVCHDIGMLLGREDHAEKSIMILRAIIPGWDSNDPFCARVEYLIRSHDSKGLNVEKMLKNKDKTLAMLVLADECAQDRRVSDQVRSSSEYGKLYAEDSLIRVAEHTQVSAITCDKYTKQVRWIIKTDTPEKQATFRGRRGIESKNMQNLFDSIVERLLSPRKIGQLLACAETLLGKGYEFTICVNGDQEYILKPTHNGEGEIFEVVGD